MVVFFSSAVVVPMGHAAIRLIKPMLIEMFPRVRGQPSK